MKKYGSVPLVVVTELLDFRYQHGKKCRQPVIDIPVQIRNHHEPLEFRAHLAVVSRLSTDLIDI